MTQPKDFEYLITRDRTLGSRGAFSLRIPHDYFTYAGIQPGDQFRIRSERGHDGILRLVIEPVITKGE